MLSHYGPWAVVAGASEGLGAAFAQALAAAGLNLVLIARRAELLEELAHRLEDSFGVPVMTIPADLGIPADLDRISGMISNLDIGLLVYNAAFAPIGEFVTSEVASQMKVIDVNIRAPVSLIHDLVPRFLARASGSPGRRAGIILMSSLSGENGSPRIATYSASKAFNTILGRSLWSEFRPLGIDLTVCCAGAVRTPGYQASTGAGRPEAPGTLDASAVVAVALRALGRKPFVVPGLTNKIARFLMIRVMPVKLAVKLMARATRSLGE